MTLEQYDSVSGGVSSANIEQFIGGIRDSSKDSEIAKQKEEERINKLKEEKRTSWSWVFYTVALLGMLFFAYKKGVGVWWYLAIIFLLAPVVGGLGYAIAPVKNIK